MESKQAVEREKGPGRIEEWKRQLLDLSASNRLLAFRDSARTLELSVPDLARLEDRLVDGASFLVRSLPEIAQEASASEPGSIREKTGEDVASSSREELEQGRLCATLPPDRLETRLTALFREARTNEQETGANNLFLVLGMLRWFETTTSTLERKAPLLLLPVRLERARVGGGFRLGLTGEDTRINVTLLEKMRVDFLLDVTGLDELPGDESGVDVARVLGSFRERITGQPRWEVLDEAWLGLLQFQKFVLWRDLEEHATWLAESEVARHLIATTGERFGSDQRWPDAARMDDLAPAELVCPLDADSSQLAAVKAAADGLTFILQGPPGTGKSQTITNMIAHLITNDRKVLFVAEKAAALEVVQRRLEQIGLGPACLAVHSHRAGKREVLQQIRRAVEWTAPATPRDQDQHLADLATLRDELDGYVEALTKEHASRRSVLQAIERRVALGDGFKAGIERDVFDLDAAGWNACLDAADALGAAASATARGPAHPLRHVGLCDWSPSLEEEILRLGNELLAASEALQQARAVLAGLGLLAAPASPVSSAGVDAELALAGDLLEAPGRGPALLTEPGWKELETELRALLAASRQRDELAAALARRWTESFLGPETSRWRRALEDANRAWAPLRWWRRRKLARDLATLTVDDLRGRHEAHRQAWEAFAGRLCLDRERADEVPAQADWFQHHQAQVQGIMTASKQLRQWAPYQRALGKARSCGLGVIAAAVDAATLEPGDVRAAAERSLLSAFLDTALQRSGRLARFTRVEHERKIARFRELDHGLLTLNRVTAGARCASRIPALDGDPSASSEAGILRRELEKKARHLPLRQLFARLPRLLPRLKPCLLMSPLSVAQYLTPSWPRADVVIFDEASQIPVWDAIGALGRGRAAVVVGDSKQLPPTAFFARSSGSDDDPGEDEDTVKDLESILDECKAAGFSSLDLRWHYRSQHESLITFSNHHYYDNRLHTFPSATDRDVALGVQLVEVKDGVYDRGRSAQNRGEAVAVVTEVMRRLARAHASGEPVSLGIVAFSKQQSSLLEDLLDEERRKQPDLDPYFTGDGEPVFVKNLENVQGDERDVILFSICYGPDAAGNVAMHFGPLNRAGGERRLNVAITRARRELLVFATLRPEQIDLRRTPAEGVKHLKTFLDYARRGSRAIVEVIQREPVADFESPLEKSIHDALVARGHELDRQVGASAYRIDLAVIDPHAPGRYLLGIECDGATYHSAATARDRDRLRQAVLEKLGWRLHRVWSTDWWHDAGHEIERIEAAIAAARAALAGHHEAAAPAGLAAESPAAGSSPAVTEPVATEPGVEPASGALPAPAVPVVKPENWPKTYEPWTREAGTIAFESADRPAIARVVTGVVEKEGPIVVDLLVRRVAAAFGRARVTARVKGAIEGAVERLVARGDVHRAGEALWPSGVDPASWRGWRTPSVRDPAPREVKDIPLEELANAAESILRSAFGLPRADLFRQTAATFGVQRVGPQVRARLDEALALLVKHGRADDSGETIGLP